ncbi:hypothetical protein CPT_Murica187 [Escherichia phage Murica]|uniref:Uncharacterized protein n=1 Tax=Escherichia phage Murica TaxID=1675606 RepID=A0A0K1LPB5_9CAUD|nr:hypothetical protein FDG88_gp092 [Escherichia phage Murica]AKU44279.1 hypothetical protein CPT_Murica187 [Escherichia phage Murica]
METKILILAVVDTTEGAIFESAGGVFLPTIRKKNFRAK